MGIQQLQAELYGIKYKRNQIMYSILYTQVLFVTVHKKKLIEINALLYFVAVVAVFVELHVLLCAQVLNYSYSVREYMYSVLCNQVIKYFVYSYTLYL